MEIQIENNQTLMWRYLVSIVFGVSDEEAREIKSIILCVDDKKSKIKERKDG